MAGAAGWGDDPRVILSLGNTSATGDVPGVWGVTPPRPHGPTVTGVTTGSEPGARVRVVLPGVKRKVWTGSTRVNFFAASLGATGAAFDALYRRTAPWLTARLRRRRADEDVVAEVLQETYLAVWRSAGSQAQSSTSGSAVGWLWTIAAHRLIDAFRHRARQERVPVGADLRDRGPGGRGRGPRRRDGTPNLERALHELPAELRQVLRSMVLDGFTARETALLLGMPEGTVKTRARRARIALREALS